jgi:uncharacterized protein
VILRRRGLLLVVLVVAAILAIGRAWGAVIGDHAWFDALGYGDVWWWRSRVSLLLKCGAGTIATFAMRAHLEAIRRSFVSVVVPGNIGNLEFNGAVPDRTISLVLWAISFCAGVLLTLPVGDWVPLASALDARPFGEADPYFQYDLAFWTAWLPFEIQMYTWALLSHAIMSLLVVIAYVLTRGIGTDGRALRVTRHARRHITVLGALLLLLISWSYRIDGFDRLVHGTGPDRAFGFADHRVGLPGGIIMQVIALAAAAVVIWSAWSRQPRAGIGAVTTVLLMALLLRQGTPLLADSVSGGDEAVGRERRYVDAGASFTRRAYESDRVIPAEVSDTASLLSTPLWDRGTLPRRGAKSVGSLLAWSAGQGMPEAVAFDALTVPGMLPTWRVVDIDPAASDPLRRSTARPRAPLPPIVVSDSGRGYAIVSDPANRIAAPGIAGFSARLAHAWNQQNLRLLFGTVPAPAPVLVTVRDVRERVALLAPTLQPSARAVPLVAVDSLWWALDLYAVSETYPLSEHHLIGEREVSAAQFAATALVNAHSGRVMLAVEPSLPLLARRPLVRLQRHLVPVKQLPEALRRSLPPRADALELEASIAARYGSRAVNSDTAASARSQAPFAGFALVRGVLADSTLTADDAIPVWLPQRGAFALTAAAIDAGSVVRGVLIAPGGEDRRTRWRPANEGASYSNVIRAADDGADSLRAASPTLIPRRGTTRVVPGPGSPRFLTPFFTVRDGRPTELAAVLLSDGLRRGVAASVPEAALAWRDGVRTPGPGGAAASIYQQMREALQRGAWNEFGASFEALGRALGVPRDSTPR